MTTIELILELQRMPKDAQVHFEEIVSGFPFGSTPIKKVEYDEYDGFVKLSSV